MNVIELNAAWRYRVSTDDTPYHDPDLNDQDWNTLRPKLAQLPVITQHETLWLRMHFDMPPNDECAYWWLEFPVGLPDGARLWVNFEAIDIEQAAQLSKWDVTHAIFIGDNVVTLQLSDIVANNPFWQEAKCVPLPCNS